MVYQHNFHRLQGFTFSGDGPMERQKLTLMTQGNLLKAQVLALKKNGTKGL